MGFLIVLKLKNIFCIPLLDKIKCAIILDSQEKECHFIQLIYLII